MDKEKLFTPLEDLLIIPKSSIMTIWHENTLRVTNMFIIKLVIILLHTLQCALEMTNLDDLNYCYPVCTKFPI